MFLLIIFLVSLISLTAIIIEFRSRNRKLQHKLDELNKNFASVTKGKEDLQLEYDELNKNLASVTKEKENLENRFRDVIDLEAHIAQINGEFERHQQNRQKHLHELEERRQAAEKNIVESEARIVQLHTDLKALDEEANLQSYGVYEPRYDFATSELYQARLEEIRSRQKEMIKSETAASSSANWTVNGSAAEGRKQIKQTIRLMLRAFNGEADAAVAKVKYNNFSVMESRIRKAFETINNLAQVQQCRISQKYLSLKIDELFLAFEYQEKLQAEKEEQRQIREQMREEERALREIEKARADAEKEERRYEDALERARREAETAVGESQQRLQSQIEELQAKLDEAQRMKERAISQAQLTRSGHVYVISNIGSFGEDVYKIGMTRRLEPMDRIRELSDASVPFDFDVHAVIYADDAPALESALHRHFDRHRINRVNQRKEFFGVSIHEIAKVVREHHGEIEFTLTAEARDYRTTLAIRDKNQEGMNILADVAA